MTYRVVFSPEAQEQLVELYCYIANAASSQVAARYVEAVINYCESLCTFPTRGARRDDIRLGLRVTHYKKRTVIAFDVDNDTVSIVGVFYGGQNYEFILQDDWDDDKTRT